MKPETCPRCEDFADDARKVLNEQCAPDEFHCSCVPHLRAEVVALRLEVAELSIWRQRRAQDLIELANMTDERDEARATAEELRLTLAAEQGRAEGAPSEGWTYGIIDDEGGRGWRKPWRHGMIFAWGIGCYVNSSGVVTPHPGGWNRCKYNDDGDLDEEMEHHTDETWHTRAAMQAADAATATHP